MKTAVELAIQKIDEQIEIAQVSRVEASKVKDATSMNRHHGMKIALIAVRQDLVNLLDVEKQQIMEAYKYELDNSLGAKILAVQYYDKTFKQQEQ